MKKILPAWLLGCALIAPVLAGAAIQVAQAPELAEMSLEQLTMITVSSASRRDERLIEAPTSIFVITADDIRRSGATSIPEILRLAPNLHVARADNNQYAISARGFNNVLANKMLVMIDGRTVYTPLFSGVFWEAQDTFLEDIERIEVISGPAATLWGANGVNGVINITTYSAKRTPGTTANVGAGTRERGGGARIGGTLGPDGHYRVYAKYFDRDNLELVTGAPIRDASKRAAAGFRADWERGADTATVQGDAYWGDIDQVPPSRAISGANLLARWQQEIAPGSSVRVHAYYDRTDREHPGTFKEALDTFDLEALHSFRPWATHQVVWGAGYRYSRDRVENTAANAFLPADRNLHWGNVFAQDEIALHDRLQLTIGLKLETNIYTGTEWLPNVRLAWQPASNHLVWGALSRAVRAPSRIDRDFYLPGQPPFLLVGNETFESEIAKVAELGYRAQLSDALSLSVTAFHHDYPNLRSVDLTPNFRPTFANTIEGKLDGVEAWASYRVDATWRLSGGFVAMNERLKVIPGRRDLGGLASLGTDPKRTALLRSGWDITPHHELDLALRHVGELGTGVVPAYTVLDARFGWRISPALELSIAVQNAFDRAYTEWGAAPNARALLERNVFVKLAWKMQ
jgi:iron complex outermembrane receptor protein